MNVSLKGDSKKLDVKVVGRIDSTSASDLDQICSKVNSETEQIVFDFSEVEYISSVGLRKMLQIRKSMKEDAVMTVLGADSGVAEIFHTTGFDKFIDIVPKNAGEDIPVMKSLFEAQVKKYGDKTFIHADRDYSFNEIDRRSQVLAWQLFSAGVHKGSHVGLFSMNSPEWVIAFFAIQKCDAIVLPLTHSYTAEDIVSLSQIGDITHLCAGCTKATEDFDRFADAVTNSEGSLIQRVFDIRQGAGSDMSDSEYEAISAQFRESGEAEDNCLMLFTSGSTGKPKAVLHSSYSILHAAKCAVDVMSLTDEDNICMIVPFSHTLGLVRCFFAGLMAGAHLEIPESTESSFLVSFIDERKCTIVNTVPTSIISMVNDSSFSSDKVSSVRCSILVGEPVTESQMRMLMEKMPNNHFISSYGMSELSPITMTKYGDTVEHICRTVGTVADGVEVGIFDFDTGERIDSAQDKKGEIAVKGTSAMTAYYKLDPDRQAIDKDGWIKTGDFGFFDKDKYLHINGRMKELIHSSGKTIEPNEVGSVISSHPAVEDIKVLGVPCDKGDEIVVACIVPKDGMTCAIDEMDAFLKEKLDEYKVPSKYLFYDRFMTLANGKIDAVSLKNDAIRQLKERQA